MVTRSLPIWPAIRMPLNTREGVAQAPIAPGERCLRSVPWLAHSPAKPWRFIDAREPLPLETPTTSACSPGLEDVGLDLLARRRSRGVVGPELDEVAAGLGAGRVEVTLHRLGPLRRGSANASWTAS